MTDDEPLTEDQQTALHLLMAGEDIRMQRTGTFTLEFVHSRRLRKFLRQLWYQRLWDRIRRKR